MKVSDTVGADQTMNMKIIKSRLSSVKCYENVRGQLFLLPEGQMKGSNVETLNGSPVSITQLFCLSSSHTTVSKITAARNDNKGQSHTIVSTKI